MKNAGQGRSIHAPLKVLALKAHHHVPLSQFDDWVGVFVRQGHQTVQRMMRRDDCGIAVCDFGHFDVIGRAPGAADDLLPVDVSIEVSCLLALATQLRRRGIPFVQGPELDEQGWRLVARHPDGTLAEYCERVQ